MSPEMMSKIAGWRAAALEGKLSTADMAEAIRLIRGDRKGAAIASAKSRTAKAKAEVPTADDLLSELDGL